ncbi:MAG: DNA internalization-related competence protein ComEC/Rec2 [Fibrella sp.]|nr:DNA internalization-related competence protein ComEC/Rec2 [Armatimonadota bacterium]
MRVSPLVGMTAALLAGILAAPLLPAVSLPFGLGVAILFMLAAICLRRHPLAALLCWLVPFAVWGTTLAQQRATPATDDVSHLAGQPSFWLAGTVTAEPETQFGGNTRYPLQLSSWEKNTPVSGALLVTQTPNAGPVPRFGDTVAVRGQVELPPTATNPGGFDYRVFLWRKGIFATLIAKRTGDMRWITPGSGNSLTSVAAQTHRSLLSAVARSPLPPDDKALVAGVLLSERSGIAYETDLAFERTGAVHILSVSGLHLAVFATVLSYALRHLPANRGLRNAANLVAILLLWTFALASGLSSATVRSAVMLTVILLAPVFRRDADPLHSLVVAAFVILFFDPLAIYDVGFQLSLACVGGILMWMNSLRLWLFPLEYQLPLPVRIGREIVFLFMTGCIAQVSALPLTAYHFSLVSLIAPLAGIVLVPVAELLLVGGMAVAGLSVLIPLPAIVWLLIHWLCAFLVNVTSVFAAPDLAAVSLPPPSAISVITFYIAFVVLSLGFRQFATRRVFLPENKPRPTILQLASFPVATLFVLPLLIVVPPWIAAQRERNELRVTFLDVGQGDAAVIETPDGAVAVIDGGGYPGTDERYTGDPGSRIVVPFLRRRGIHRVDWLIPTHPDEDHVQGLIAVTRAFPVRHVLDGGVPDSGGDAAARLRQLLRRKQVPWTQARRGQTIALGTSGVTLEVLHPAHPLLTNTRSITNANCVVLRLRYKNATLLFTGDAEETAEESLLRSGVPLQADVLKVGHHGSRFSSGEAFLKSVSPSVAIISCGRENNFGHPAADVLAKLKTVGATTYRTDRSGAIVITTNGERVFVAPVVK